jgi:hypothetical protein
MVAIEILLLLYVFALVGAMGSTKRSKGQEAVEDWLSTIVPSRDYNATGWRYYFHSRSPQTFFDKYLQQVSNTFKKHHATLNFAMVGACDGLADPAIRDRFLPNKHWQAIFVEPMSVNVRDLIKYLQKGEAFDRSVVLRAAATKSCQNPTLQVERPLYEEKNELKEEGEKKNIPHWLRREIGSVLKPGQTKARPDWTLETVRCVTASNILEDWAVLHKLQLHYKNWTGFNEDELRLRGGNKPTKLRKRRPHVLKIDVEGHDYEVLMSFINDHTPLEELPILIEFEGKSIGKDYPAAKATLESRGYVVSNFAADGFAMLKREALRQSYHMIH